MTPGEFAAIEARLSAATEGPWSVGSRNPNTGGFWFGNMNPDVPGPVGDAADGDVQFITHAREDIPALLAAVRERDNTIARVRALAERWAEERVYDTDEGTAAEIINALDQKRDTDV